LLSPPKVMPRLGGQHHQGGAYMSAIDVTSACESRRIG
jgi:hypothetical protein